ncbi:hypothetical protein BMS3Abin16_01604 [archaeon BMS3Abin16]|nr:hypothetical protein BMS3Abin16_01604 [archaeon BMS3Abin16]
MNNRMKFWISGTPATFATKNEVPWKQQIEKSIPSVYGEKFFGMKLKFILHTLAPLNHPLDVDNLCEPAFSVIINKLGWIGGRRPNLKWWNAEKIEGKESGLELLMESTTNHEMTSELGNPFFDDVFNGKLPHSATDPEIPTWLDSLNRIKSPRNVNNFVVRLQFGDDKINIGDIATGRVKSVIDCLYPLIGGMRGKPKDWRINILQVEKNVPELNRNSVRVRLWNKS